VAGSAALVAFPRVARATGGLDVAGPTVQHPIRVLLASGAFEPPRALDAWHFAWGERTYRGTFASVTLPDGRAALVNTLPLDAYLAGVLSKEVSASWTPAAQQAQAIVARTYALGKLRPAKPYDVVASEADQRYDGIEGETVEGRAAVETTAGAVVTFDNEPAHVAYSSCCGGMTADAADIWNTPYPYLRAIVDPHCTTSPVFAWQVEVPIGSVDAAFGSAFGSIGALRSVDIAASDPQARPRSIRFVGDASTFEVSPSRFRATLGTSVVRSTFVRAVSYVAGNPTIVVSGTGRGHGVGMCQWGARDLGASGASAREIVAFYFPGTDLGRA